MEWFCSLTICTNLNKLEAFDYEGAGGIMGLDYVNAAGKMGQIN